MLGAAVLLRGWAEDGPWVWLMLIRQKRKSIIRCPVSKDVRWLHFADTCREWIKIKIHHFRWPLFGLAAMHTRMPRARLREERPANTTRRMKLVELNDWMIFDFYCVRCVCFNQLIAQYLRRYAQIALLVLLVHREQIGIRNSGIRKTSRPHVSSC